MKTSYLSIRCDEAGEGQSCLEALASVQACALPAARTELQALIRWAEGHAPGRQGPAEEGGAWDFQLDESQEGEWTNLSLSLVGPSDWCSALLQAFGLDD